MAPSFPSSRHAAAAAAVITISSGSSVREVAASAEEGDEATSHPIPTHPLASMAFPSSLPSRKRAAATITISDDDVVDISSDDDDATSRPTRAPRRQRRPSPPPAVATGDEAPRRQRRPAAQPRRAPSPPPVVTVDEPPRRRRKAPAPRQRAASPAPAPSTPKRKYRKWSLEDDRELLTVIADLNKKCDGIQAPASEIRRELIFGQGRAFSRPDVPVAEISDKIRRLKKQFKAVHKAVLAGGNFNPRRKYRDGELYRIAKDAWPKLFKP